MTPLHSYHLLQNLLYRNPLLSRSNFIIDFVYKNRLLYTNTEEIEPKKKKFINPEASSWKLMIVPSCMEYP